jgi:hypothetical protein
MEWRIEKIDDDGMAIEGWNLLIGWREHRR